MKNLSSFLFLLFLISHTAHAITLTYHNPDKAIERAEAVLTAAFFKADAEGIYKDASKRLRNAIPLEEFQFLIEQLVYSYPHKNVKIYAYEHYGTPEQITVFAKSQVHDKNFFYALSFQGSGLQGYELENLRITSTPLAQNGIYQKLDTPMQLESDISFDRLIDISNSEVIAIEAVTKTFFEKENIYAYTLKYRADVDMEDHESLQTLAVKVMEAYAGDKAIAYGAKVAVMTVSKASRLDDPKMPIQAFRTLFNYENGKWQQSK